MAFLEVVELKKTYEGPRSGGKAPLLIGGLLALLIVGGGAAAYFGGLFDRKGGDLPAPIVAPARADPIPSPQDPEEKSTDPEIPEPDEGLPPPPDPVIELVKVSIISSPSGAVVEIEGKGQVCSETPCELDLEAGETVEITGRHGKRKQTITFTPSDQNKNLELSLKARPAGGGKSGGGLKIPDLFKDN